MASQFQRIFAVALLVSSQAAMGQATLRTTVGYTPTVQTSHAIFAEYTSHHETVGASAYANLATGKIGAGIYSYGTQAVAIARFDERIYFHVDSENPWVQTPITFHISLNGSHGGATSYLSSGYSFSEMFYAGALETKWITTNTSDPSPQGYYINASSGCTHNNNVEGLIASCTIMVGGFDPIVDIGAGISAVINPYAPGGGGAYSFVDYMHTSAIGISVPDNVSWRSRSGVFLSELDVPNGVPEPASWALLIIGFGAVGVSARSRRRLNAPSRARMNG